MSGCRDKLVGGAFLALMLCLLVSPGSAASTSDPSAPQPLPRDMGMSEFDRNEMLKYTVNPTNGNLVVRISLINIPSQLGPPLNATLTYNSQFQDADLPAYVLPDRIFGNNWSFSYDKVIRSELFYRCDDPGGWEDMDSGDILLELPEWEEPDCCNEPWDPFCCDNPEWPPGCCFWEEPDCCGMDWEPECCFQYPFSEVCYAWESGCCWDYSGCIDGCPEVVEYICDVDLECDTDCERECEYTSDPEECYDICYADCCDRDYYYQECLTDCDQDNWCYDICGDEEPSYCDESDACMALEDDEWPYGSPCAGFLDACDYFMGLPGSDVCFGECEDPDVCEMDCYEYHGENQDECDYQNACGYPVLIDYNPCEFDEGQFSDFLGYFFFDGAGDIHLVYDGDTNPEGNPYHYALDPQNASLTLKDGTKYIFDGVPGDLLRIEDRYGNEVTVGARDEDTRTITDAVGRTIVLVFNQDNLVETLTDPAGNVFQFQYEGSFLTKIINPELEETTFAYEALSELSPPSTKFLTKITYPELNTINFDYQKQMLDHSYDWVCTEVWKDGDEGVMEECSYVYSQFQTIATDSLDHTTTQKYASYDYGDYNTKLINEIIDHYGKSTTYTFDGPFNLINTQDTNLLVYTMTYDGRGNLLTKKAEVPELGDPTTTYTYESYYNQVTSFTDPNINTWYYHYGNPGYGPAGTLWKEEDPEGNQTLHWYNTFGQRVETRDARGNLTLYGYGSWGYLTEVTRVTTGGNYTTSFAYDTCGNKVEMTDANGVLTTYQYDSMKRLLKQIVHDQGATFETSYLYDDNGNLRYKTDPRENTTEYVYDSGDRLAELREPEGRVTYYGYDTESNKTSEKDPNGNTTVYEYDALNRLEKSIDPLLGEVVYLFEGQGDNSTQDGSRRYDRKKDKYTRKINALNYYTRYAYDELYRLKKETDYFDNYLEYAYDRAGNKTAERDKRGYWTYFSHSGRNLLLETKDPKNFTVRYEYDENGNKRFEKDKRGYWTEFSYDERNLLIGITDPLGNVIAYEYDGVGNKTAETDKRGKTTEYEYDGRNLLTKVSILVGGLLAETDYGYDANGNKTSETDPNDLTTAYAYDDFNRLVSKRDALWNSTTYVYDPNGNRTYIIDANENETDYDYDALNRLTLVTDALGGLTRYAYDAVGNKVSARDARWSTTTYVYDALDRLIEVVDPRSISTHYDYDPNGNRDYRMDGNGDVVTYEYDELNRLEARNFPDQSSVTYTYDPNGNRLTMTDPQGTISYSYDNLNRLTWTTVYGAKTVSYAYDANSNRSSMTSPDFGTVQYPVYDEMNRLKRIVDPQNGVTTYSYDLGGRLEEMVHPNGTKTTYQYDDANRLTGQETKKSDNQTVVTFAEYPSYDNVGNRLTMVDPQGTTTYRYDDLYRLSSVAYPDSSWASYTYDAVGNRTFRHNPFGTLAYEYNRANELTHISQDYTSSVLTVSGTVSDLDEWGDPAELASVTVNGVEAEVGFGAFTAYDVPIALGENRIVAEATDLGGKVSRDEIVIQVTKAGDNFISFGYDDNGNLVYKDDHGEVTSYYYDFENRLVRVVLPDETGNEFVYDGDKRRIGKKAADGTETGFLYDGLNILQDLDGDNNIKAAYLQGIGIDKLIARTEWVTETVQSTSFYHSDALGSVRSLTDANESEVKTYAYDAWGKVTAETGSSSNQYKFTSREFEEEIGLQYNRARFYDPEIGRFITRDPLTGGPDDPTICYMNNIYAAFHRAIKEHVDSLQPHKLNRYVYCYNNPVNLTDPLGLLTDKEFTKMVEWSRDKGYEIAPGNLEYWKSGEGGTRTLDAKYFKDNEYVSELTTQYEESKSYRSHVTEKATRLMQQNPDAKHLSGTTDYHEISARFQGGRSGGAGPDLDYGLGSFDIVPRVNFKVTRDSNDPNKLNVEISSITYHVEDEYNWDKGKSAFVPPLKRVVTDSEMQEYGEKVGAQEYFIRSEKWESDVKDNYTVTIEGTENTSGTSQNIPQAETPESNRTGEVEAD